MMLFSLGPKNLEYIYIVCYGAFSMVKQNESQKKSPEQGGLGSIINKHLERFAYREKAIWNNGATNQAVYVG